jgi:hypothetical protein
MPSMTLPKTTCLPSRKGVGTVVMKNWDPLPSGPAFWEEKAVSSDEGGEGGGREEEGRGV